MTTQKEGGSTIAVPMNVLEACRQHHICRKSGFSGVLMSFSADKSRSYASKENPDGFGASTVGNQGKRGQVGSVQVIWPGTLPEDVTAQVHMRTLAERLVKNLDEVRDGNIETLNIQPASAQAVAHALEEGEYVDNCYFSFKLEAGKIAGTIFFTTNKLVGNSSGKDKSNRVAGVYTFSVSRVAPAKQAAAAAIPQEILTGTPSAPAFAGAPG